MSKNSKFSATSQRSRQLQRSNSSKREGRDGAAESSGGFQDHYIIQEAAKEMEENSIQILADEVSGRGKNSGEANKARPGQSTAEDQIESAQFHSFDEGGGLDSSRLSNRLYKEAPQSRIGQGSKAAEASTGKKVREDPEDNTVFETVLDCIQVLSRQLPRITDEDQRSRANAELARVKEAITSKRAPKGPAERAP